MTPVEVPMQSKRFDVKKNAENKNITNWQGEQMLSVREEFPQVWCTGHGIGFGSNQFLLSLFDKSFDTFEKINLLRQHVFVVLQIVCLGLEIQMDYLGFTAQLWFSGISTLIKGLPPNLDSRVLLCGDLYEWQSRAHPLRSAPVHAIVRAA